jgi:hypothetical protein
MNTLISFLAAGLLAVAFTASVKTAEAAPLRTKPAVVGRTGSVFLNPQPLPPRRHPLI